jgi:hypothetical protein
MVAVAQAKSGRRVLATKSEKAQSDARPEYVRGLADERERLHLSGGST